MNATPATYFSSYAEATLAVQPGQKVLCATVSGGPKRFILVPKAKPEHVALECLECGKKFKVSPNASDPSCPKCGGVDWDVR